MDRLIKTSHTGQFRRAGLCAALLCMAALAGAQDEWANVPDPTRPAPWKADKAEGDQRSQEDRLSLDSTIVSDERRLAIINGKTVPVGGTINGSKIVNITPFKVELEQNGRIVTLLLVNDKVTKPGAAEAVNP